MHYDDEAYRLFEVFSETLGIPLIRWEADPVHINIYTRWVVGDTIEKLGDTPLFAGLSAQEKFLACSIQLKLRGEGRQLRQFLEDEPAWTLPQLELMGKLHEIFDGMIAELDSRVRRLSAFFVVASNHVRIALPPQLAPHVIGIRHIEPGYECIDFNAEHSHPSVRDLNDSVIDAVLDRAVLLGGVEFETADNRMIRTPGEVAWPVIDQDRFMVDLYARLIREMPQ